MRGKSIKPAVYVTTELQDLNYWVIAHLIGRIHISFLRLLIVLPRNSGLKQPWTCITSHGACGQESGVAYTGGSVSRFSWGCSQAVGQGCIGWRLGRGRKIHFRKWLPTYLASQCCMLAGGSSLYRAASMTVAPGAAGFPPEQGI